ncbi:DUF6458 family protein [Kineococcus sp. SYSU DK001]|uniref:DUF6458 family protein n=1 Tax=Kineococcus sp. SYSU DK001 TaxID=3383122 RepID=UPI003D7D4647
MHLANHRLLFTVGAVLAFAVHVDLDVVDVEVVGWILMLVAVVATLLEVAGRRARERALRAASAAQPTPARVVPARVTPSLAPWDTREFRPVPRPARES